MFTKNAVSSITLLSAVLFFLPGCGKSGPELGYVTGKVTYRGQPLPTGSVIFVPETSGMPLSFAEVQADGTYIAATKRLGKGVAVGRHKVMINAIQVFPGKENDPVNCCKVLLPAKYSSEQTSGLTAVVNPGENIIDFAL